MQAEQSKQRIQALRAAATSTRREPSPETIALTPRLIAIS
jgi:hypothetical protein